MATLDKHITDWRATADASDYVAHELVDAATALIWNFTIERVAPETQKEIVPRFLTVDNTQNGTAVSVAYGNIIFTISPYKRNVFNFPAKTQNLVVTTTKGQTDVYLSEKQLADSDVNNFAIAQAGVPPLSIPVVQYTTSKVQLSSDDAYRIVYAPAAADAIYDFIDTTGGSVQNGFFSEIQNLGPKKLTLRPSGAQTINNFFTNAAPLVLLPGQSGTLVSDGSNWFWDGEIVKDSSAVTLANFMAGVASTFAHNLPTKPKTFELWARCKVSEANYAIGDEIVPFPMQYQAGTIYGGGGIVGAPVTKYSDATNVYTRRDGNLFLVANNKTSGAQFQLTSASWDVFFRCVL